MSGSGLARSGCTSETVKVSGPDDILNEMLIYGGGKMVETLIDFFNLHGDKRKRQYQRSGGSHMLYLFLKRGIRS